MLCAQHEAGHSVFLEVSPSHSLRVHDIHDQFSRQLNYPSMEPDLLNNSKFFQNASLL
jgi:hypothetical protein